jgi:hypothetical protein
MMICKKFSANNTEAGANANLKLKIEPKKIKNDYYLRLGA